VDEAQDNAEGNDLITVATFAYWFAGHRQERLLARHGVQASLTRVPEDPDLRGARGPVQLQTPASDARRALALLRETVLVSDGKPLLLPPVATGMRSFWWVYFFFAAAFMILISLLMGILPVIGTWR